MPRYLVLVSTLYDVIADDKDGALVAASQAVDADVAANNFTPTYEVQYVMTEDENGQTP